MEVRSCLTSDLILENAHQVRHTAQDICGSRDHTTPHGPLFLEAVEWARIVIEPLRKELKLLPLHNRVAVSCRIQLRTLWEMRDVAADAKRSLLVDALDAIHHPTTTRRIRVPRIAGGEYVVQSCANRFMRVRVGGGSYTRVEFVLRMIRSHAHVIRPPVPSESSE